MQKITINRPFRFFLAVIELILELLISNMHNKLEQNKEKKLMLSRPRGQIIDIKCEKSQ